VTEVMRTAMASSGSFRMVDPRQVGYLLRLVAIGLLIASFFAQDTIACLCVTVPVLIAPALWVNSGAFGVPVLPVISGLFYLYYAMPLFVGSALALYKPDDIVSAELSVGLFLCAAAVAAFPFFGASRSRTRRAARNAALRYARALQTRSFANLASNDELYRLIFIGLIGGIFYYLLSVSGAASKLGTYLGVVRAGILPLTSIACYLIGFARGSGSLSGSRWSLAVGGFVVMTLLSMSGLFLISGAINVAAAMLGYVLAGKRIPWLAIGSALAIIVVFNAGKYSMRTVYWAPDSQSVQDSSILKLPTIMANWFMAGLDSLASDEAARRREPTLLERTSLLHMVLAVQEATPTFIPYLEGETYAMLPAMLVPRFLQPDKIESQAALNLLSVRYGREREEDTEKTTIGWGMVAEAYANFGNLGVIVAGAVFGVLCGMLMRLSTSAAPVSLAMLITIASTLLLCNVELDFSSLILSLLQSIGGILLFSVATRAMRRRRRPAVAYVPKY
jgi:hypothetical protein